MSASVELARVYSVSGGTSSAPEQASYNSTSLPDILRRSGSSNKRKKRKAAIENDKILSKIELIQDFEFPVASNKIRCTNDGMHIMATGSYKPQIRVWECEQLSLKFERHTDAENVDFLVRMSLMRTSVSFLLHVSMYLPLCPALFCVSSAAWPLIAVVIDTPRFSNVELLLSTASTQLSCDECRSWRGRL